MKSQAIGSAMKRLCRRGRKPKVHSIKDSAFQYGRAYWVECGCGLKTIQVYSRYWAWREWEAMQREEVERG
jgi:hypothetical protein